MLIPYTSLTKLNQLPTKESNDNTYVAKEAGKSLIEDSKIAKLNSLPNSVYSQVETQQIINDLDTKVNTKVDKVAGSRLITEQEANKLASVVTSGDLDPYSLKDTKYLEEFTEILIEEEKNYIKFFDEEKGIEKKISMWN